MDQHVLGRVIAMAESLAKGEHLVDEGADWAGDFGQALLNATVKGIDPQLRKDVGVPETFELLVVLSGNFVNESENLANMPAKRHIDAPRQQFLLPDPGFHGCMAHGK